MLTHLESCSAAPAVPGARTEPDGGKRKAVALRVSVRSDRSVRGAPAANDIFMRMTRDSAWRRHRSAVYLPVSEPHSAPSVSAPTSTASASRRQARTYTVGDYLSMNSRESHKESTAGSVYSRQARTIESHAAEEALQNSNHDLCSTSSALEDRIMAQTKQCGRSVSHKQVSSPVITPCAAPARRPEAPPSLSPPAP